MKLRLIQYVTVVCLLCGFSSSYAEIVETIVLDELETTQEYPQDSNAEVEENMVTDPAMMAEPAEAVEAVADTELTEATDKDSMEPPAVDASGEQAAEIDWLPEDLYIIQPGDVLIISVWDETDLSGPATVLPDGTLSFQLIGILHVAGKTLPTIIDAMTQRLSKYISDPVVTVKLDNVSGNQIYVIGNVTRPGAFAASRNLDVMQLLSLAGGMTSFAAVNKVKILRRVNNVETVIHFRYRDVEKGKRLEQNILLKGGDVVIVP